MTQLSGRRARSLPSRDRQLPLLIGREEELKALAARLDRAGYGEGGIVLIAGEPGIGKTRLLHEFADCARRAGWLVLSGSAYDTEGMPPYLPFVAAIREHARVASDEELMGIAGDAPSIAALIPDFRTRFRDLPSAPPQPPEAERFRHFEAVSEFFLRVAHSSETRGLLLCLDDLHWADPSTLALLLHLSRKLRGTRLLVAATYRPDNIEPARPLFSLLADLAREGLDARIPLSRLSAAETAAFVESVAGITPADAVVAAIQRDTEGNPFYIEELVRQLRSEERDLTDADVASAGWRVPGGIRDVIGKRLSRLTTDARRVLSAAAVVGGPAGVHLLQSVSALPDEATVNALEEVAGADFLREDGPAYIFGHQLMREVVYEGLSLARRQQLHARVAETMESREDGSNTSDFAALGHHLRQGGQPARAIGYLLRAGDAALALTAWEEAIRDWTAALECMEQSGQPPLRRARLLEGLGDLHFLSSFQAHPCVECYERAAALYESAGERVAAAKAHSRAGRSLAYPTSGFDYAAAADHLRAAEQVLRDQPDRVALAETYAALAHAEHHALRGGAGDMVGAMHRLREIAEDLDNECLRRVLHTHALHLEGHLLTQEGHLADGLAMSELAYETATTMIDEDAYVNDWPKRWHEFLLTYSSDEVDATAFDRGSYQFCREHSRAFMLGWTANCSGFESLDLYDPVSAAAKHERVRDRQGRFISTWLVTDLLLSGALGRLKELVEAGEIVSTRESMLSTRVALTWSEGRWEEAEKALGVFATIVREQHSNHLLIWFSRRLLGVARSKDDLKSAEALARECLDIALRSGTVKYEFACRAELALLLAECDRTGEAAPHIARCREILAQGEDWLGLAGREALAEAVFAAARGQGAEAASQFERAIEIFRTLSLAWDEAVAYELWARSSRRFYRGPTRRAFVDTKLGAAREVYKRIGAGQPWLDRLDAMRLDLVGPAGPPIEANVPDGLSEREVEVLQLIAAGKSNREIAEDLVLSVRTVERHITNIYAKTDAHTKAQATAYAMQRNLSSQS